VTLTPNVPELTSQEAEALQFLLPLSADYPHLQSWYLTKVVPGIRLGTRHMIRLERDGQLAGLGIAKAEDELKICTVRIAPNFAGRGMGVRLFDGLLHWLGVDDPHLTVTEQRMPLFERIFDWYGFQQTSVRSGVYRPCIHEFGYNESVRMTDVTVCQKQSELCRQPRLLTK
jgi:hypothetical protein